jgi:hypothetical protein
MSKRMQGSVKKRKVSRKKPTVPARKPKGTTAIARAKNAPDPGPGHDHLCSVLRGVYDWNKDIAGNERNSKKDRATARAGANKARADAAYWGCEWAERM